MQRELEKAGQGHLTSHWSSLSKEERKKLCDQIVSLNLTELKVYLKGKEKRSGLGQKKKQKKTPLPINADQICSKANLISVSRDFHVQKGLYLIAEGKVAVLLLAGGQGTRLGTKLPKGCVDIKLPSKKTLFQIQAERILSLQKLAAEAKYGEGAQVQKPIIWYIMLSHFTRAYTEDYFEKNSYFGLQKEQIFFFTQGKLPCVSEDGKVLLESPSKVSEAPDGNGGIYRALRTSGCLKDMAKSGVEAIDCYSVDNLLVKAADPFFVGYCFNFGAELGLRTVAKVSPNERVGVFVKKGKGVGVVEYSEIDSKSAAAVKEDGELLYNWSNICMQYFSRKFLEKVCKPKVELEYHVAAKNISTIDGLVKGLKLEKFIFDVFPLAKKTCLVEVSRSEEFAPVKNAFGEPRDSPDTARKLLMMLHRSWAEDAGASFKGKDDEGLEISPLISYGGENLEMYEGKVVKAGTTIQDFEPHTQILDDAQKSPLAVRQTPKTISQDSIAFQKVLKEIDEINLEEEQEKKEKGKKLIGVGVIASAALFALGKLLKKF